MIKNLSQNSIILQVEIFEENFISTNNFIKNQGFIFLQKIDVDYFYKIN